MKIRHTLLVFAILFIGSHALSEDEQDNRTELETYVWLEREGMFDKEVPNKEIHELISTGLRSEDPEIVHYSVRSMSLFLGVSRTGIERGLTPTIDRQLQDIPELYDILIKMWDDGWKKAGGAIPEPVMPDDYLERIEEKSGSLLPGPAWTALPMIFAYLFPGDEKVYKIIWDVFPSDYRGGFPDGGYHDTNNPGQLLSALYTGKFDNPKDQQFRIDILMNKEATRSFSSLAARSLGDLRSDEGFEALATVLQNDNMKHGTPHIPIVEAMIKYEEKAVPYISLMRERLAKSPGLDSVERELKITLKERLVHFEKKIR